MATYVNDLRLKEIATGDESGSWGTSTNTNLELIAEAMGVGAETIPNASTHTITMADGTSDEFRSLFLRLTGGGTACTVTLAPNTLSHTWVMRNETAAALTLTQGSGANVIIAAGQTKIVATDGAGSGAAVYEMDDLELAGNLDVNGLTADGLTVDGNVSVVSALPRIILEENDTTDLNTAFRNNGGVLKVQTVNDAANSFTSRLDVDHATGDISFYEDTGTTPKFFWDASTERLGIGNAAPATALDVTGTVTADGATIAGTLELNSNNLKHTALTPNYTMIESDVTGENTQLIQASGLFRIRTVDDSSANPVRRFQLSHSTGDISFYDGSDNAGFFWDSSAASLGIGTTSPATLLELSANNNGAAANNTLRFTDTDTGTQANQQIGKIEFKSNDSSGDGALVRSYILSASEDTTPSSYISFGTNPGGAGNTTDERMRIDSSGNVLVGTDSGDAFNTYAKLRMQNDNHAYLQIKANSAKQAGVLLGDTDDDFVGGMVYDNSDNSLRFNSGDAEALRIDSSVQIKPAAGSNIGTLQNLKVSIGTSATLAIDMGDVVTSDKGAGFYMVSIVRSSGSYGRHFVGIFGVNGGTVVLYETLRTSGNVTVTVSGTQIQASSTSATVFDVNAIPLAVDKDA